MDDALQRKRFCEEIERDFSVIAPAGVGKTFSIVERIHNMACRCPQNLASLCVVTYTKKAAEELKRRVSERLQQHPRKEVVRGYLAQSFFGTLHSLCWQHIRWFDADTYELLPDDCRIREQFIAGYRIDVEAFKDVLQFVDLDRLLELTESFSPNEAKAEVPSKAFNLNLQPIYDYAPEPRNRATIPQIQAYVKAWEADYLSGKAVRIPETKNGGKAFIETFYKTLEPFFSHLSESTATFVKTLARDYFEYRIQHGYLKHADLVFFAERCLDSEKAKAYFLEHPITILLDEAQDTDEHQFCYIQKLCALNPKNRFSMVGDPQQSIYERANISTYLKLHQRLVAEGKCEPLVFSNTFRCPKEIVQVLNQKFPYILCKSKNEQQVDYVPLISASKLQGNCETVTIPPMPEGETDAVAHEARHIAKFLENYLRDHPRAPSEVCFLVPRKHWLEELKSGLSQFGLNLQIYSNEATYRDNRLFCAILTFVHLINFPEDSFQLAGLLHGIFHINETEITLFDQPLQIEHPCDRGTSPIISCLDALFQLRKSVVARATWDGVGDMLRFFKPLCSNNESDSVCEDLILDIAFQIQRSECTWCALELRLQNYLDVAIENEQRPCLDAFQGFSCHKAKGLEWPTVILPFFYRPIRYPSKTYPFLVNDKIVWNKYTFETSIELLNIRRRELQRLLYVTCTRAKQHLIILNDKSLWKPENTHPSFGQLYEGEY